MWCDICSVSKRFGEACVRGPAARMPLRAKRWRFLPLTRTEEETESPEPPAPRESPEPPARRKSPVPPSVSKRRRLSRKTRPAEERQEIHEARKDHENIPAVVQKSDAEGHPDVFLNAHRRTGLLRNYAHWWRDKEKFHALSLPEKRVVSAKYNLRSSHPKVLETIFRDWAVARPAIAKDIDELRKGVIQKREVGTSPFVRATSVLYTWSGPWGVVAEGNEADAWSSPEPTSESLGSSPVPTDAARFPEQVEPCADAMGMQCCDPEHRSKQERQLAVRLRSHEAVLQVKEKFLAFVREFVQQRRCTRYAWAVEVCRRTFRINGNIRLRTHAVFDFSGNRSLLRQRVLLFQGTAPHETNRMGALSFSSGNKCGRALAMYYLQAPKVSCIFSGGSHKPFTDYGVAACNIIRMLEAQEMLYADALSEMNKVPLASNSDFKALELCYNMQCMRKQPALQEWHR